MRKPMNKNNFLLEKTEENILIALSVSCVSEQ